MYYKLKQTQSDLQVEQKHDDHDNYMMKMIMMITVMMMMMIRIMMMMMIRMMMMMMIGGRHWRRCRASANVWIVWAICFIVDSWSCWLYIDDDEDDDDDVYYYYFRALVKFVEIFLANIRFSIIDWSATFGNSRANKGHKIWNNFDNC